MQPHVIVFSHGFGVRKDDQGLFTDIASGIPEARSILFDYNEVDEAAGTLTVPPPSKQAEMLRQVIADARRLEPDAVIDLVGHSQGTVIAALARPAGVRKMVFLAPVFDMSVARTLRRYEARPESHIDLQGVSRIPVLNAVGQTIPGTVRLIPREYWKEREALKPFDLYNDLAEHAEIFMVIANQDVLVERADLSALSPKIKVGALDGDHNFSETRSAVVETVRGYLGIR